MPKFKVISNETRLIIQAVDAHRARMVVARRKVLTNNQTRALTVEELANDRTRQYQLLELLTLVK